MKTNVLIPPAAFDNLPNELQVAQSSINLPEVQELIQKLSKYNLGVCMPHRHNIETGAFEVVADNELQVESDLKVSFVDEKKLNLDKLIPVAWIWKKDGTHSYLKCINTCVISDDEPGVHLKKHTSGPDDKY